MHALHTLSAGEFSHRLARGQLQFRVGPYTYNLKSNLGLIRDGLLTLYPHFPVADPQDFTDFSVALDYRSNISRARGLVDFFFDHQRPFGSIPKRQAYAFMEWGMNWCVSLHSNEYLKLHAAVIARNDSTVIMPGVPGAGKSTLCAAMGLEGWRILSDEHALVRPGTSEVVPLCRPVSLKNESIEIIRKFSRNAVIGPLSRDTHKGSVAHMKADLTQDSHDTDALPANIMLFPRYSKEDKQQLRSRPKTESFLLAAYHSFNYSLMGADGFQSMKTLVDSVDCYDLVYHDLDWAIKAIENLNTGEHT